MWLRLLIPLTLIWPVLALAAEGTPLRRYRGTPTRELLALSLSVFAFFGVWIGFYYGVLALLGSEAAALVAASLLALLAVPVLLFLAYRLCGLKASPESHAH